MVERKQILLISILTLILLALPVSSVTIPLQTCGISTATNQGSKITLENNCIKAEFSTNGRSAIKQTDKINNEDFILYIETIEEVRTSNGAINKVDLKLKFWTDTIIDQRTIQFSDGNGITIEYQIIGNELHANAYIKNYSYLWADGELWIETETKETSSGKGKITSTRPEHRDKSLGQRRQTLVQNKRTESRELGKNRKNVDIIRQKLGRSSDIFMDPIFSIEFSPIPATHLINGTVITDLDSAFQQQLNITTQLNDNLDSTSFEIKQIGTSTNKESNLIHLPMESSDLLTQRDVNNIHNLATQGITLVQGIQGQGINFGVGDTGVIGFSTDLKVQSNEDMVICLSLKDSVYTSTDQIIDKKDAGADGWQIEELTSGDIQWTVERSGSQTIINGDVGGLNDGNFHKICVYTLSNGNMGLYYDGVLIVTDVTGVGTILDTEQIHFSNNENQVQDLTGDIDEFCMWKGIGLNQGQITSNYNNSLCGADNKASSITGSWNQTFNPNFNWFARLRKIQPGNTKITIQAYDDVDTTAPQINVTKSLLGLGWFNINISNIMNYETNTQLLNFTKIRIYSQFPSSISELQLRKETNDTTPPIINNCFFEFGQSLNCTNTITHPRCNVTDDVDVDFVNITIGTLTFPLPLQGVIFPPVHYGGNITIPINNGDFTLLWTNVSTCDISGNCANFNPQINLTTSCNFQQFINITHTNTETIDLFTGINNVTITWTTSTNSDSQIDYGLTPTNISLQVGITESVTTHTIQLLGLTPNTTYYYNITSKVNPTQTIGVFNFTTLNIICTPNFICSQFNACNINNTQICQNVTDTNSCGQPFNGTISTFDISCNFCSEDVVQLLGICTTNSTQTVDFTDLNLGTCCAITNITNDCTILTFPFNTTTTQSCLFFNNTMNCDFPTNPTWDARMPFTCEIPLTVAPEEFSCKSEVKQNQQLIQTNPEQRVFSIGGLLTLFQRRQETKEFFTPSNRLLSGYITKDDISPETQFELTVTCTSTNTTLLYGQFFTVKFEQNLPNLLTGRIIWIGENKTTGIFFIFILFILMILGALIVRRFRRTSR